VYGSPVGYVTDDEAQSDTFAKAKEKVTKGMQNANEIFCHSVKYSRTKNV